MINTLSPQSAMKYGTSRISNYRSSMENLKIMLMPSSMENYELLKLCILENNNILIFFYLNNFLKVEIIKSINSFSSLRVDVAYNIIEFVMIFLGCLSEILISGGI
jgi:hypothetical protein